MLRSQFVQSVVHGFESVHIKLGFEAKVADAQTARYFLLLNVCQYRREKNDWPAYR